MPMSMSELASQCLKKDNSELRRTVYLCTDDNLRGADMDVVHPQDRMMDSDYIVMPRGSVNTQASLKDDSKLNIGMETLPHERLLHYKVNPDFSMNPNVMDQFNMSLDQHLPTQEHMQNLPFEPRTAVKNFIASEMDDSTGLARSETGSTISMSSLEVSGVETECMHPVFVMSNTDVDDFLTYTHTHTHTPITSSMQLFSHAAGMSTLHPTR